MRQVGGQVPRRFIRQLLGIGGGHHSPPPPLWTVGSYVHLQGPPRLLVPLPKTPRYLHPFPGVTLAFPPFCGHHGRRPWGAYLAPLVPPGVRGLQGQHVSRSELRQGILEAPILAVERVGYHRLERDASAHG